MQGFLLKTNRKQKFFLIEISIFLLLSCFFIFFMSSDGELEKTKTKLDLITYDILLQQKNIKKEKKSDIVVVKIDDQSLFLYGRWPWPRSIHARIIEKLLQHEVSVIAFDVIFPESEKNDVILANAMARGKNVVSSFAIQESTESKSPVNIELIERFLLINSQDSDKLNMAPRAEDLLLPVPIILKESSRIGAIITKEKDMNQDGIYRQTYALLSYETSYLPSLAFAAISKHWNIPLHRFSVYAGDHINIDNRVWVPIEPDNSILINYYTNPNAQIPELSVIDILKDNIKLGSLKNKIVLIGSTATGAHDVRPSPLSATMPGVLMHAHLIQSILNNDFISLAPTWVRYVMFFVFSLCFFFLFQYAKKISHKIAIFICSGVLPLACSLSFFIQGGIWIPFIWQSIFCSFFIASLIVLRYFIVERSEQEIKTLFGDYVSPDVVESLIANPHLAKVGGEKREITILFSDIAGYTSLSEKVSPEEVVEMLNELLGEMSQIILKWDGCVNKFVGDCIVAFWNAPLNEEHHAVKATKCALEMKQKMIELRKKWIIENKPAVNLGIGINTGEVFVGNIGLKGKKMDYTVIGDPVNLCARIEGKTREHGMDILITEYTHEQIMKDFQLLGHVMISEGFQVTVKGREQPVTLFRISDTEKSD